MESQSTGIKSQITNFKSQTNYKHQSNTNQSNRGIVQMLSDWLDFFQLEFIWDLALDHWSFPFGPFCIRVEGRL